MADNTTVATQWVEEVEHWAALVDGGAARHLDELVSHAPAGAEAFAAYARITRRLNLENSISPAVDAQNCWGTAGNSAALLVGTLLTRIHALLDAGQNDPTDPLIRPLIDFPNIGLDGHGRRIGYRQGMKPAAAARLADVAPLSLSIDGAFWVLGDHRLKMVRTSAIRLLTDATRERIERETAERERLEAHEREKWEHVNTTTPQGMAARIVELEKQAKATTG